MKRLLDIEFQKLWLNKASRILILSYFILLSFIALISSVKFTLFGIDFHIADMGIFNFPYIWHFNTFIAAMGKIFLAVVIVSMMANEYTYGTLKQNLIDGLSKEEFIKTKFLTVLIFALASTVFVFILSLILGYSFSSYTEASIVFSELEYVGAFFLKLLAFFSFCLFVGILIKRSAFALGFIAVWYIFEKVLYMVYGWSTGVWDIQNSPVMFLPMESMSNLLWEPMTRLDAYKTIEGQVSGKEELRQYGIMWYEYFIVLGWTAIFILTSYRIVKKRDL